MMKKKMEIQSHHHLLLLLLALIGTLVNNIGVADGDDSSSLQDKCSPVFTKLSECISYASAKAEVPTSSCCSGVSDIRAKEPECLCYIIQQVHAGGANVKSLGLQFQRLLQLPTACKLANATLADCPKLLNIPPSSPDYALFTNATKATATPTSTPTTTGSASGSIASKGIVHEIFYGVTFVVAIISASFLYF